MDKFQGMHLFARVVETGSFTAAAGALGISRALASKLIQTLEESLGVRLLNRTTRRVSLTDAGRNYYQRISDILAQLAEAEAEAAEMQVEPRGKMRVSAPISFSVRHLAPALSEFQRRYPRVELELELSDRVVDLVDEPVPGRELTRSHGRQHPGVGDPARCEIGIGAQRRVDVEREAVHRHPARTADAHRAHLALRPARVRPDPHARPPRHAPGRDADACRERDNRGNHDFPDPARTAG